MTRRNYLLVGGPIDGASISVDFDNEVFCYLECAPLPVEVNNPVLLNTSIDHLKHTYIKTLFRRGSKNIYIFRHQSLSVEKACKIINSRGG